MRFILAYIAFLMTWIWGLAGFILFFPSEAHFVLGTIGVVFTGIATFAGAIAVVIEVLTAHPLWFFGPAACLGLAVVLLSGKSDD